MLQEQFEVKQAVGRYVQCGILFLAASTSVVPSSSLPVLSDLNDPQLDGKYGLGIFRLHGQKLCIGENV